MNFTMRLMNTKKIDTKCDLTEKTYEVPDWNLISGGRNGKYKSQKIKQ